LYKIPANTLFLGKNLIFVPECHSTNTLALELSQQRNIAEGSVVITNHQTAGRGQRGNTWESQQGKNLTLSLFVKPAFLSVKNQFYLNIFTCLAIYDTLRALTDVKIAIKWPNDILVQEKKACGILIENQIRGSIVSSSVIGIGLNVNQAQYAVATATSLSLLLQRQLDLNDMLEMLLGNLESRYLQLKQNKESAMKEEYLSLLYWKDEERTFRSADFEFQGIIQGIDESGRLEVNIADSVKSFDLKEITYIQ
jgi:BirA family biotin operon repressor/biotin-[acetyl-CoA-carboxylase] ligase